MRTCKLLSWTLYFSCRNFYSKIRQQNNGSQIKTPFQTNSATICTVTNRWAAMFSTASYFDRKAQVYLLISNSRINLQFFSYKFDLRFFGHSVIKCALLAFYFCGSMEQITLQKTSVFLATAMFELITIEQIKFMAPEISYNWLENFIPCRKEV